MNQEEIKGRLEALEFVAAVAVANASTAGFVNAWIDKNAIQKIRNLAELKGVAYPESTEAAAAMERIFEAVLKIHPFFISRNSSDTGASS